MYRWSFPAAALTLDQRRSPWLGAAIAGELAPNPDKTLAKARSNLAKLQAAHPKVKQRPGYGNGSSFSTDRSRQSRQHRRR
jgi:hypothetical protein